MSDSEKPVATLAEEVSQKRKDSKGVLLTAAIVAGHAIKHVYMSGFQTMIFPEMKIGLGLSNTMLGALAAARQMAAGATTLGAGYLGDRFSGQASLLLAISLGLMGVSYLLVGSAYNNWLLLGAMLLVGLGPSLYHPPALGTLSRRFPERRGFLISLHGTGGSIGEAFGPLIGAVVVGVLAWRATLQWSVGPALAAAAIVWLVMRGIPMGEGGTASFRAYFGALSGLLKNRVLVAVLAVSGIRNLGQSAVVLFLPVYLREDLGFSLTRVGFYYFLAQVAGIVAQPFMGALSDRWGRKAVLCPSLVVFSALLFALKFVEPGFGLVAVILTALSKNEFE